MSIESEIQELTAAVKALTAAITSGAPAAEKPAKKEKAAPAPVVVPEVVAAPVIAPPVAMPAAATIAPTVMPPPPSFIPPTPPVAVPASTVPFTDGPGLIEFTMAVYKELGAQKGAAIQNVLVGLGVTNINDLPADKYAAFYTGVMALKG